MSTCCPVVPSPPPAMHRTVLSFSTTDQSAHGCAATEAALALCCMLHGEHGAPSHARQSTVRSCKLDSAPSVPLDDVPNTPSPRLKHRGGWGWCKAESRIDNFAKAITQARHVTRSHVIRHVQGRTRTRRAALSCWRAPLFHSANSSIITEFRRARRGHV